MCYLKVPGKQYILWNDKVLMPKNFQKGFLVLI